MKKVLIALFVIQTSLNNCFASPNSSSYQKEIKHMQDYYLSDQTERNESIKNQAFDDLRGCPILIKMGRWSYVESMKRSEKGKMIWERSQSWMYPSGMISETDAGINDEDHIRSKDSVLIYVGPWKDIHLEYGWPWNKTKIDRKIRRIASQKKNDVHEGYIYGSYEFMTPHNQNIPEQPITLAKNLPTPEFETFCKVKWVAKYGYNAVFDEKSGKIIEAKE